MIPLREIIYDFRNRNQCGLKVRKTPLLNQPEQWIMHIVIGSFNQKLENNKEKDK